MGQFLFLGSASIDHLKQSRESLVGRISYLELFPINILEYAGSDAFKINTLWLRGGLPESLLSDTDLSSILWRRDFIDVCRKTYKSLACGM
jgi:predicted AAA+ superfamily ATPase